MTSTAKKREKKAWRELVDGVQALYPEPLPQVEAEEAAHNLVEFFKLLMGAEQEQLRKERKRPENEGSSH